MIECNSIEYEKTDISKGIDVDKTNKSKECMLCHYWYFLDHAFAMVVII